MRTLGIDTSNYTTSCAFYDGKTVCQQKRLLPVKAGEKGLRQSDAVFHHTQALYELMEQLFADGAQKIDAIGVSEKPRNVQGSYMPCFTVGINVARSLGAALGVPVYGFSHQCGHLAAALYSCGQFERLKNEPFIAFHVSGGTTEMLQVTPGTEGFFHTEIIGGTSDLNAGQAIDRAGVMLGLPFPCGAGLEQLALQSQKEYAPKVFMKDGFCSLSGLENKCRTMIEKGEAPADVARFCLDYIASALSGMTEYALQTCGNLPLVYAGGVMSDSLIRSRFSQQYGGFFAEPAFSCDNAAGAAVMAYERNNRV